MASRRYDRADQWSPKPTTRPALPSRRENTQAVAVAAPGTSFADVLKPYKSYIILGVAALGVLIAYQLYVRRTTQRRDPAQVEAGVRAIDAAQAQERPKLQVDPQVIEVLQNQVLTYQQQVAELEEALGRNQQQMAQMQQAYSQQQQEDPIAAQMRAAGSMQPQQFTGLHGQVGPHPDAALGRGAPSMGGFGPQAGTPTRGDAGAMSSAFAQDNGPMPAMSGFGGGMSASDYTNPFQDGVTSQAMTMGAGGGGRNPPMQMPPR